VLTNVGSRSRTIRRYTRLGVRGEMSCDAGRYIVQSTARGLQDGDVVHERSWRQEFERDLG